MPSRIGRHIRKLAVASDKRMAELPNGPSLKELSLISDGAYAWQGLVGPKGMPQQVGRKLSGEVSRCCATRRSSPSRPH